MKIIKQILSLLLRVIISAALLFILFHVKKIDLHSIFGYIRSCNKALLLAAGFIFILNYMLGFVRWMMLLKAINIQLPIKRVFISFCGGIFFNLFLPSSIGGDVTRSIDLAKHTQKAKEIVATVLLDRLSGYVGMVIVVLISLFFGWGLVKDDASVLVSVAVLTGILIVVLIALFNKFIHSKISRFLHISNAGRLRESLGNLIREIHYFRNHKKLLFCNLLVSIAIQMIGPLAFYVIVLSLGAGSANLLYFFIFVPIVGAITLLPISVGGFGLRENASVHFFAKAGMNEHSIAAAAFLNSIFILVIGVVGGLIYVFTVRNRRLQHDKPSPVQFRK